MSFERTQQSIKNLSGSVITAEGMLDMLIRTTRDVYENNGVKGANDLQVSDGRQLVIKMNNLMNLLNRLYANNTAALAQVSEETRNDLQEAARKLGEGKQTISDLDADITAAEERQKELTAQNTAVTAKRGHLRTVKEDCDKLQNEIDLLNDPHLDGLAAKKTELEAERNERKGKSDGLKTEISDLETKIGTLNASITADTATLENLTKQKKELDAQLSGITDQIEAAQKAIEEHDTKEAELQGKLDGLQDRLAECEARFSVIQSAWNSAARDAFLQGKLFTAGGTVEQEDNSDLALTAQSVENFAQLESWFERTGTRIEGLLQVYGGMLKQSVERAKQLTAEQEGDNG